MRTNAPSGRGGLGLASGTWRLPRPSLRMAAVGLAGVLVGGTFLVPGGLAQVNYEGQRVAYVDLVARPSVDAEGLRPLVRQKAGEPYSTDKVRASVAALKRTGDFSQVHVEVRPEVAGLRVMFIMEPAYYIGLVSFPEISHRFRYTQLLQAVNFPPEQPFLRTQVGEAEQALLHFLAQQGYFGAKVEGQTQTDQQHKLVNVIFHVTLNRRAKFGQVHFIGTDPAQAARMDKKLRSFLATVKGDAVKPGKKYSHQRLQRATAYLKSYLAGQKRLASRVRLLAPKYNPATNRADVFFDVNLGPLVYVRVTGAHVWGHTLKKLIPIYEEASVDQDLIQEGRRNLISYFQSKGYFDVQVNPLVYQEPARELIHYEVQEGRKHKVESIAFSGNHYFSSDQLESYVVIEKERWLFSRGKFSNDLLRQSVNGISAAYKAAGFADVQVQPKIVDREPEVSITFEVKEGEQNLVQTLNVAGNQSQPISRLAPDGLELAPGKPYSPQRANQDRNQILANYLDLGFLGATLQSSATRSPQNPHQFDVVYHIQEGPQAHVRDVLILGERHTRTRFISQMADIKEGVPLSETKLLESESRLYDAGVFDWANVGPLRPLVTESHDLSGNADPPSDTETQDTQREVLIKVHESQRNQLKLGFGFEVAHRGGNIPVGSVALPGLPVIGLGNKFVPSEQSFVGVNGSVDYTRKNLRGRAETLDLAGVLGRLDQRGTFTYSDPRFQESSWSAITSGSLERTSENPIFTARISQASFEVQKSLDSRQTKTVTFRYSFNRTVLGNLLIPDLVLPQDRSVRLSTLGATYVRDTRDKPLDAHRGFYQQGDLSINPTAIGSSANFVRFLGQTAYYYPFKPWLTFANSVRLGLAKPFAGSDVPLSQRFFSGGSTTLRGFPINEAGPQRPVSVCSNPSDSSSCTLISVPVGGNMLFVFNSELRFPIPIIKNLGGAVFYDGGNVYSRINLAQLVNNYSNTVGFGLRYQTPVGPIRIDFGHNLNPVPGIQANQYFVTLGQAF